MKFIEGEYGARDAAGRLYTDRFVLSTGREFYGFGNRLSVDGDGVLAYGHDGPVDEFKDQPLTPAEKREIADYMTARWMAWGWTDEELRLFSSAMSYLLKATRFDVIAPCEKHPDGVAIVRVDDPNHVGDPDKGQWMIAGGSKSLCRNGEWFRYGGADQGSPVFTLDEAFAAVEKLPR